MYDARNLTRRQLFELAGIMTDDGFMTTGQLRRLTGLSCNQVYATVRDCRIGYKTEIGSRLYSIDDVRKSVNDGQLPLAVNKKAKKGPLFVRTVSLRLTREEADALLALSKRVKMSQSEVIRHLILTARKNLT